MLKLPVIRCTATTQAAVYQTGIRLVDIIPYLLTGYDPRSTNWNGLPPIVQEMYHKLQRKTSKARRIETMNYVIYRMSPKSKWIGAFPPLVIGMPLPQEFKPLGEEDFEDMGVLRVRNDMRRPNILLDGLGRFTGLLEALENAGEDVSEWASEITVPVTLITGIDEVLSEEQLGQMFHDLNALQVPVSRGQAIDLDRSDIYVMATNEVGALPVIEAQGGMDPRAISIGKNSGVWTTKVVLLKAVRAAAEGPGSHVDHIRDRIPDAWLTFATTGELVSRFDDSLTTFVDALGGKVNDDSLVRTATWWVAFGLILHDLYATYEGAKLSDEKRAALLRRLGKIDWGLGNPELTFLGSSVQPKDRKTGALLPKPTDDQGREMINRFFGGGKAYYNLAAFMRQKMQLRETVEYGPDYGATIGFDENGKVIVTGEPELALEAEAA